MSRPNDLAPRTARRPKKRGQSIAELALVLPLLIILFSVIVEAGLMLNSWIRVNTAARDGTRFALDAARPNDIRDLVRYKLAGMDENEITVFIITGTTDLNGTIPAGNWYVSRVWGPNPQPAAPRITRQTVQQRLTVAGNSSASANLPFGVVEVHYKYAPILASLVAAGAKMPMSSYALVQLGR